MTHREAITNHLIEKLSKYNISTGEYIDGEDVGELKVYLKIGRDNITSNRHDLDIEIYLYSEQNSAIHSHALEILTILKHIDNLKLTGIDTQEARGADIVYSVGLNLNYIYYSQEFSF